MTNSISTIKFHATTTQVQDVVIWMDDVEDAIKKAGMEETIQTILDRVLVGEWKHLGTIHIVDEQKEIAQAFAEVMNARYTKEMELMAGVAKKEVAAVATEKKSTQALRSAANTKKFLKEQAAKLANAKQSPLKNKSEEEKEMTNTTEQKEAKVIRRTKKAATKTKEETTVKETTVEKNAGVKEKAAAIKEKHAEKKAAATGRKTAGTKKEVATQTQEKPADGKMGRDKPQGESTWVKFEGPWYLNSSRYEVLKRLPQIIEDRADMELGITEITFSHHTEVKKYKNKTDLVVVEQFQTAGAILDFPIKLTGEEDRVRSSSIDWVEYKGKRRPAFGFWRANTLMVDFKCQCGHVTRTNTEYMKCQGCEKTWEDISVEMGEYGFEYDAAGSRDYKGNKKEGTPWIFQEIPNMKVAEETLVLALALAHFDQGLDMWDLIDFEEDAE